MVNVFLSVMEVFDDVTHYLMPWHTLWRHDELFNVMVCSLLQGEFFVVITYFMTCFLLSWHFFYHFGNKVFWKRIFDVIDIMKYFWLHDKAYFLRHAQLLYRPDIFFSSFWEQNIMKTCFCHHAMFLMNFLMSWQICWRHNMFLTSWRVFDVIANF